MRAKTESGRQRHTDGEKKRCVTPVAHVVTVNLHCLGVTPDAHGLTMHAQGRPLRHKLVVPKRRRRGASGHGDNTHVHGCGGGINLVLTLPDAVVEVTPQMINASALNTRRAVGDIAIGSM